MLDISEQTLSKFAMASRPVATIELRHWLCEKRPDLGSGDRLDGHLGRLVDWASSLGITATLDVYLIAEMNVLHGIDLSKDPDFNALVGPPGPASDLMLEWMSRKSPAFWRGVA